MPPAKNGDIAPLKAEKSRAEAASEKGQFLIENGLVMGSDKINEPDKKQRVVALRVSIVDNKENPCAADLLTSKAIRYALRRGLD